MFFLRLKMSAMTDVIVMMALLVATSIMRLCEYTALMPFAVIAALAAEGFLSMARAFELEDMFRLWKMNKKEVDRLNRLVSRQSLRYQKKPLKHKG